MTSPPYQLWTEEIIKLLKTRARAGESGTMIARYFAELTGLPVSRSAVRGKLARLGIFNTPITERKAKAATRVRLPRPRLGAWRKAGIEGIDMGNGETVKDFSLPAAAAGNPVTILELKFEHCRWIAGPVDAERTLYCGAPRIKDHPYCLAHCRLAYAKTAPVSKAQWEKNARERLKNGGTPHV